MAFIAFKIGSGLSCVFKQWDKRSYLSVGKSRQTNFTMPGSLTHKPASKAYPFLRTTVCLGLYQRVDNHDAFALPAAESANDNLFLKTCLESAALADEMEEVDHKCRSSANPSPLPAALKGKWIHSDAIASRFYRPIGQRGAQEMRQLTPIGKVAIVMSSEVALV